MTIANGKYLLDNNIVIGALNRVKEIRQALSAANEIFVPVVAVGELYYGAEKSSRVEANKALIDQFLLAIPILNCDIRVAHEYGRLKQLLRLRGTPIPENDPWIAAIAVRHQLAIATRDKHFQEIEEVVVTDW